MRARGHGRVLNADHARKRSHAQCSSISTNCTYGLCNLTKNTIATYQPITKAVYQAPNFPTQRRLCLVGGRSCITQLFAAPRLPTPARSNRSSRRVCRPRVVDDVKNARERPMHSPTQLRNQRRSGPGKVQVLNHNTRSQNRGQALNAIRAEKSQTGSSSLVPSRTSRSRKSMKNTIPTHRPTTKIRYQAQNLLTETRLEVANGISRPPILSRRHVLLQTPPDYSPDDISEIGTGHHTKENSGSLPRRAKVEISRTSHETTILRLPLRQFSTRNDHLDETPTTNCGSWATMARLAQHRE
ncbi:hypothetical protein V8C35DRAFT_318223 [Trichoderma chlorosporum]